MSKKRKGMEDRLSTFFTNLHEDLSSGPKSSDPAVLRQLDRMKKRARYFKPELEKKALDDFVRVNSLVGEWNRKLDRSAITDHMSEFILHVLERYTKSYDPSSLQECFSTAYILDNWAFGPGVSNGNVGSGTVEKIDQPMSCTRSAEPLVLLIRKLSPYFLALDSLSEVGGIAHVSGSMLLTVLKNEDAVRTIAKEPSGNMAIQLAGGRFIEGALRMLGLDIRTQQVINRALARIYSLDSSGATIDLKSASDMFSKRLIEITWPKVWFDFFMKYRSPQTTLSDGRVVQLEMMSTMGNGFTFPMMTLTLLALIYAVRRLKGGPYRFINLKGTAVFGDDIIVPKADFDDVVQALQSIGLLVNVDKSFNDGPFRESCGGDFYIGRDITPFYVKTLSTPPEIYVAINQLLRWSSEHSVPIIRALRFLLSLLGPKVYFVPQWLGDTSGIRADWVCTKYKYLRQIVVRRKYAGRFSVPLACGGYLESAKDGAFYSPRLTWVKYESREARLPCGFLDGWDPSYRSRVQSAYIQLMVELSR